MTTAHRAAMACPSRPRMSPREATAATHTERDDGGVWADECEDCGQDEDGGPEAWGFSRGDDEGDGGEDDDDVGSGDGGEVGEGGFLHCVG